MTAYSVALAIDTEAEVGMLLAYPASSEFLSWAESTVEFNRKNMPQYHIYSWSEMLWDSGNEAINAVRAWIEETEDFCSGLEKPIECPFQLVLFDQEDGGCEYFGSSDYDLWVGIHIPKSGDYDGL